MAQTIILTKIEIKVDGTAVDESVTNAVREAIIEQHTHLPDMFILRLAGGLKLLENGPFDLAKKVEIAVSIGKKPKVTLITGEITALEPEFQNGMVSVLVVRGYDKSHRLFRESKSRAFLNVKDSDLASEIARSLGLRAVVDPTRAVYAHVYQDNQSDLAFLTQRAWRIGYECFVRDNALYFRKPPSRGKKVTLTWGKELISFSPSMALAGQVGEVVVRGWDPKTQKAIVGRAKNGQLYPKTGESKDGAAWAKSFGAAKQVVVDIPVTTQAEANSLAQARMNELSGAFIEAEGVAYRRPELRAGEFVEIEGVGDRFGGAYLVTQVTHLYDISGLKTTFTVRGAHTGLLTEQIAWQEPVQRWPGLVTAVVTNTDDPEKQGRVKVKYPWMAEDAESGWARVAVPGGGPAAGLLATPAVGDEVLVAFEHGDINHPFILGGLWNGKHSMPSPDKQVKKGEQPLARVWQSRKGHYLLMRDDAEMLLELAAAAGHKITLDEKNKMVNVVTAAGHEITLNDQDKSVEIASQGGHKVILDDNGRKVTIQSSGQIEIKASTGLKIESGGMIDIKASGPLSLKGAVVKIN